MVCWFLPEQPKNLKLYWKDNQRTRSRDPKEDEFTFYFTQAGIDGFLRLKPTAIALEPTGYHYSAFLARVCEREGIEIYWVGHSEVNHHRRGNKLPDKNDLADALALADYLHKNYGREEFFLQFSPGIPKKLRECYLQLQSLNRMQSPIINRLRQQLALEFPEAALVRSFRNDSGLAPLWAWLSGQEVSKTAQTRYDKLWANSVAQKYGGSISQFSRQLANELCNIHLIERGLEEDIEILLCSPEIAVYEKVLNRFGMKARTKALILSQVYPISRFDALPQFKKRLGCAGEEQSSGDKEAFNTGAGSKLCRQAMYLWVLTTIAPKRLRPGTPQCQRLGEFYDLQRQKFYGSPEEMRKRVAGRELRKSISAIEELLKSHMEPLINKGANPLIQSQLDLIIQLLTASLNQNLAQGLEKSIKQTEVQKGFGNLIIMRTAGRACKMLFQELKRSVASVKEM